MASPILSHFLKNITVVKFDNREANWGNWRWEFDRVCEKLGQGKPLNEKAKMMLLEMALPEGLLQELKLLQRTQNIAFTPFMAKLEERFGRGQLLVARKKWEMVELANLGKIKTQHFREFEVRFRDAWKDVYDATESEAHRMLMVKLPEFMRMWVLEKQEKSASENPIVIFNTMEGLSIDEITRSVKVISHETPTKVVVAKAGEYLVHFPSISAAKKLTALHGRQVKDCPKPISAKLREQRLGVDEVFDTIAEKLRIREMGDEYAVNRNFSPRPTNRGVRETRSRSRTSSPKRENRPTPKRSSTPPSNPYRPKNTPGAPLMAPTAAVTTTTEAQTQVQAPPQATRTTLASQPSYGNGGKGQYRSWNGWGNNTYSSYVPWGKGVKGGKGPWNITNYSRGNTYEGREKGDTGGRGKGKSPAQNISTSEQKDKERVPPPPKPSDSSSSHQ